ncbi:uncharacterized protein BDR25DRAFT_341043 [Lindgomyces ingoldianus]|uniref:Uncharacterized protein n=1 Tax=Lindgomyces ingoldianus TaxID=673940 RepID=A0ACB6R623_9PLEO|nr:uncharacterized protein BDR25DRAFT_341043 [Lindgomyces ingoldianus]KAF2473765.1 hypothetical protein BDR25DRAFT_341043 [Lindgomyces ingoldianus]
MVENRGPEFQVVCSTFVAMAFVATMLRIYVRLRLVNAFGWDDTWMVFATLCHIFFASSAIGGVHYGTGRHMRDLTEEGIFKALRFWWLCYISYCWTMIGAKISIGLFLLRVTVNKMQRWIIYTVMGLTVLTGIVFFFVTLLQCRPVSYFWNKNQPGSCINIDVIIGLTYLYSAISAICDFTFGILPMFLVWNLNMSRNAKIALVPILSMACVASTAVIVRMAFVMDFKSDDFLYDTIDIAIWSDIEQGLAITAGSLATLRPLYRLLCERLGLSRTGTNPLRGTSGKETRYGKRSAFSGNDRKKGAPFNLVTFARHENGPDEEYGLGSVKPMPLPDGDGDEDLRRDDRKGFSSWRIQAGDGGSEEELHKKVDMRGITRQTDVFLNSESAHWNKS